MDIHLVFVVRILPLWFLVFSLFLPRIAMFLLWMENAMTPYHLHGIIPLAFAILLPRVLVLYMIYLDQGISLWFLLHLVVAVVVWGGSGNYHSRRMSRNN
jgi:hypothetical protein